MALHSKDLYVDFTTHTINTINVSQYDKDSRVFIVHLLDNGVEIPLEQNEKLIMKYSKPDGTFVINDCVTNEDGTATLTFTNQMCAVEGVSNCQLAVANSQNGTVLHTMSFKIQIEKCVIDDSKIESSNEMTTLNRLIIEAETAAKKANDAADSLQHDFETTLSEKLSLTGGSMTGTLKTQSTTKPFNSDSSQGTLQIAGTLKNGAYLSFHEANDHAVNLGIGSNTNEVCIGGLSMGNVQYPIVHEGNIPQYVTPSKIGAVGITNGTKFGPVDWNKLDTAGCYKISICTMTAEYNAPAGEYAYGVLQVIRSEFEGEFRTVQIYYPHQGSLTKHLMWVRMRNQTWTEWKSISSNDKLDSTFIKDISSNHNEITYTKGDGTITKVPTQYIAVQDTEPATSNLPVGALWLW